MQRQGLRLSPGHTRRGRGASHRPRARRGAGVHRRSPPARLCPRRRSAEPRPRGLGRRCAPLAAQAPSGSSQACLPDAVSLRRARVGGAYVMRRAAAAACAPGSAAGTMPGSCVPPGGAGPFSGASESDPDSTSLAAGGGCSRMGRPAVGSTGCGATAPASWRVCVRESSRERLRELALAERESAPAA